MGSKTYNTIMYGQPNPYGQPPPPPPTGFVPPPMAQPMMPPGVPMQPGMPMQPAMPMQQPMQQQTQVVTTTTTTQGLGADGKPGSTWSRNQCCFIVLVLLIIAFSSGTIAMNNSIKQSIETAAHRDEVYAVVGKDSLCDNKQTMDKTTSKANKNKCVDMKAKWYIKADIKPRSDSGFKNDVIDDKCTEMHVKTEMYVKFKECKNRKNHNSCYEGERDCSCRETKGWVSDQKRLDSHHNAKFPCNNCLGVKKYDNGDNAVLRQTSGVSSVDLKVTPDLKQKAIKELGKKPLTFGNSGKTEICLTKAGGQHYGAAGGFYAYDISSSGSFWTNCDSPSDGNYKMSATCLGPPSNSEIRVIGGLDAEGDRLGGFKPEKGVAGKNKEKLLIWETEDLDGENKGLIVKHQNDERFTSEQKIQAKTVWRNILAGLVVFLIVFFSGLCILG